MAKRRKKSSEEALREALKMIAPGTKMRDGISAILQSGTGALLCIGEPKKFAELSEGGVSLDAKMTPQLLYELSKMDGAIMLNRDASRILFANRYLKPDPSIPSDETGTRHRVAERLAHQASCIVIAVSQRRSSVTLYVNDIRHVLDTIQTLLNKASQAVQTLEKYVTVKLQALQDLTTREFQDMVTIFDVCRTVQRMEQQQLMQSMPEAELVIRDYYRERTGLTPESVRERIAELSQEELLNLSTVSQVLGYGPNLRSVDTYLTPRGHRVLTATHRLSPQLIQALVQRFGSLQQIIRAQKDELCEVEGVGEVLAERVRVSLNLLRSQLALEDRR